MDTSTTNDIDFAEEIFMEQDNLWVVFHPIPALREVLGALLIECKTDEHQYLLSDWDYRTAFVDSAVKKDIPETEADHFFVWAIYQFKLAAKSFCDKQLGTSMGIVAENCKGLLVD